MAFLAARVEFVPPRLVHNGMFSVSALADDCTIYGKLTPESVTGALEKLPAHTRVVTVADVKGGVGKTTSAANLAIGIHRAGQRLKRFKELGRAPRVLMVDADQYNSLTDWMEQAAERGDPWPDEIDVIQVYGDNLHHAVAETAQKGQYDFVVGDAPPNDKHAARRLLSLADLTVIPTGASQLDLRRMAWTVMALHETNTLRGYDAEIRALLTGVKQSTLMVERAKDQLDEFGLPYFATTVRHSVRYPEAFGTSMSDRWGIGDYRQVANEVLDMLVNKITRGY
jgi:chromosome partitioning protein